MDAKMIQKEWNLLSHRVRGLSAPVQNEDCPTNRAEHMAWREEVYRLWYQLDALQKATDSHMRSRYARSH